MTPCPLAQPGGQISKTQLVPIFREKITKVNVIGNTLNVHLIEFLVDFGVLVFWWLIYSALQNKTNPLWIYICFLSSF